jgi:hypothetical protein
LSIRTRFGGDFTQITEKIKELVRHPKTISSFLEEHSPWLSRQFLGAASNLTEPFVVGMGLKVDQLSEDIVEVSLPGGWRNQSENGLLHVGALVTLGEFASRLFWEYHLDLRSTEINLGRLEFRALGRAQGAIRAVYRVPVNEREKILHRLRSLGRAEVESQIAIYDSGLKLIAEVEVSWTLAKQLSLGSSSAL